MKICFTSLAYPELKLADVLMRAETMGFDGVELRVADDGVHLRPEYPLTQSLLSLLSSFKVPVTFLSSYLKLSDLVGSGRAEALSLGGRLVRMASDIGAAGVRVYGGELAADLGLGLERIAGAYRELARQAVEHGVEILVETHDYLAETQRLARLVGLADEVKLLYDPANIIYSGGVHREAFRIISKNIAHVHLKDFVTISGKRIFTPPGEGVVPLQEIVFDLKNKSYADFLSVEWERFWHRDLPNADQVLPIYLNYLRRLL